MEQISFDTRSLITSVNPGVNMQTLGPGFANQCVYAKCQFYCHLGAVRLSVWSDVTPRPAALPHGHLTLKKQMATSKPLLLFYVKFLGHLLQPGAPLRERRGVKNASTKPERKRRGRRKMKKPVSFSSL